MNNNQLRIVQLIDSLDAGGAERMAVNYADVLMSEIAFSGLVVTRKEGLLKSQLKSEISYLFLNRKRILDFFVIIKFLKFLNKNNINWIHAHSSSIFFAVMIKFLKPSIKIIWHDHFGQSEFLDTRKYFF
ncbi:glycosyltransferase [Flavobacterium branchiophilum]|nr:glycosyltransferase [Flavobacterium branchiophilum]